MRDSRRRQLLQRPFLDKLLLDDVIPDPPPPKLPVRMTWKLARSLQQAATSSGMTLNQTSQAQKQIFLASDVSWFIDPDYHNFTTCECDQVRAGPGI